MKFLLALAFAFHVESYANPIRVVVLDTGFGPSHFEPNLCSFGHKDFTGIDMVTSLYNTKMPVPIDQHGHGTDMVELIQRQLTGFTKEDYCIVIVKFYSTDKIHPDANFYNELNSLRYIKNITPDVVNISGGGPNYHPYESVLVKDILDNGTKIVAAAGNESKLLSHLFIPHIPIMRYYPAMYDPRIHVVGSLNRNGIMSDFTNYGNIVNHYEIGEVKTGRMGNGGGTSQATAVFTGKLVKEMILKRQNERAYKTYKESIERERSGTGGQNKNL